MERIVDYLVKNGATFIEKCPVTRSEDNLFVLEDPWGNFLCLKISGETVSSWLSEIRVKYESWKNVKNEI